MLRFKNLTALLAENIKLGHMFVLNVEPKTSIQNTSEHGKPKFGCLQLWGDCPVGARNDDYHCIHPKPCSKQFKLELKYNKSSE